jgi:hypothetical protein
MIALPARRATRRLARPFLHAVAPGGLGLVMLAAACGSNVVVDQNAGGVGGGAPTSVAVGVGGGTVAAGVGGSTESCTGLGGSTAGDCLTDADCAGGTCVPITAGGYLVCVDVPPEATSCMTTTNGGMNACCTSADCKQGGCFSTGHLPSCGGPAPQIYNACFADACTADADCTPGANLPPQLCAPAGTYGQPARACVTAYCHTDADCTAQPCGACVPVRGPCCNIPDGLGCVYPGGCHGNEDCTGGDACTLDPMTGTGVCGPAAACPV